MSFQPLRDQRIPKVKPVVTIDSDGLKAALVRLWQQVEGLAAVPPDGLVGIATGGLVCAEILHHETGIPVFRVALRRPSTAVKSRPATQRILGALPYAISNWLRRIEDLRLERRDAAPGQADRGKSEQLETDVPVIAEEVRSRGLRHIVILDDAVDSGKTLAQVKDRLRLALPASVRISTAVVTQTRDRVACVPDAVLYHGTLCRFPWSFDFRGS